MSNLVIRFWQNSLRAIPREERFPFFQDIYFTNYYRARLFAIALFVIHFFVIFIDLQRRSSAFRAVLPAYGFFLDLHILFQAVLLIFIVLMTVARPANPRSVRVRHIVTVLSFILFVLIWAASVSSVNQLTHSQVTVYTIAVFGVAVAFFVSGVTSFLLYLIAQILFLVGMSHLNLSPGALLGHYLNDTVLVAVAWVLSRLVFSTKVREFMDNRTIERQKAEIQVEKEKSESMLKNILPESIVKQINGLGYPPPKYNASTTIVFADFVSFYRIVETSDPLKVLKILEKLFDSFDECIRSHKLEKLKTIGDGYMFAGGLFTDDDQLEEAVEAALEMNELVKESSEILRSRTGREWALRIGIHTGPAITGIIGTWRFIYDVWGPTVNIASRLEAASHPNKINVSRQVYSFLKRLDRYTLEPRGALSIKNMQPVEMYFVDRKSES